MNGTNKTIPGVAAARAAARSILAAAAMLAGAAIPSHQARAQDAPDDMAMAVPRLSLPGDAGVPALPRPLAVADARLVRAGFASPAAPLDGLEHSLLLGHILSDRFLSPATRATAEELKAWLARFPDLPDAPAVHALLATRMPRGATLPPLPALPAMPAFPVGDDLEAGLPSAARNAALDRQVRDASRAGQFDRALHAIARSRGMSASYGALLRAEVGRAMFSQGHDAEALATAAAAHGQSGGTLGLAAWIAGLAAWRMDEPGLALSWFEAAFRAPRMAPAQRAGAAFWAARASLVTRGEYGPWLHRAAADPRTFYGLLARQKLGQHIPVPGASGELLAPADVEAVADTPQGLRAFALLQVDQPARAASELRLLWAATRDRPGFGRSILLVARAAGLQDLAAQLTTLMDPATVRLPAARLRPNGGFVMDPALVYALTRLESNFDAEAVSPAGARGLMQLMPGTALYLLSGTAAAPPELRNPATNLDFGQRYLLHLSHLNSVGPDLIRLLAAYNVGPGTFNKWLDAMPPEDDPLLFIESLPGDETRAYVPRALAYSWLYAAQLHLPAPSLDELAIGLWPRLQPRHGPVPAIPRARMH